MKRRIYTLLMAGLLVLPVSTAAFAQRKTSGRQVVKPCPPPKVIVINRPWEWHTVGGDPAGPAPDSQVVLLAQYGIIPAAVRDSAVRQYRDPSLADPNGWIAYGDTSVMVGGGKLPCSDIKLFTTAIAKFEGASGKKSRQAATVWPEFAFGNYRWQLRVADGCNNVSLKPTFVPAPPPPPPPLKRIEESGPFTEVRLRLRLKPFEWFGPPTAASCPWRPHGYISGTYSYDKLTQLTGQPNTQNNAFTAAGLFVPLTCAKPVGLEVALRIRPYELINHNNTASGDASLALVYDRGLVYGRLEGGARLYERQSGYFGYTHNSQNPLSPTKNWVGETNGFVSAAMYADLDHRGNAIASVQGIYLHGSYVDEFGGNAELDYGPIVLYGTGKHTDTYRQNVDLGNGVSAHVPDNTYWTWDARVGFRPMIGIARPWEIIAVGATYRDLVVADQYGQHTYDYHRTGWIVSSTYHDGNVFGQINARFLDGTETYNHGKQSWVDFTVGHSF